MLATHRWLYNVQRTDLVLDSFLLLYGIEPNYRMAYTYAVGGRTAI